ncbi:unnamed protein product [Pocillopora meandrina]|uniref:Uncharacterized protein n=1 Tax=Pocillopora meandrina TaxID=46732 RepID=A0AAU9W6H0_9CNID|nr:uncharacterized protein LOC131785720 [Pocillopora verrucosa]CAH3046585.1 unnamed protein product [Pocillopora meandrina]
MGDVHCLLVMILVLYFPLRVKTGALKNGDISSDVTTKKTDPFKAVDMINLFRSSNFPERRKLIQRKAKKKFAKTLRRNDSTGCSSETESSDYSDNNFETSEYVDDVYDNRFNSDGSDDPKKSGGSGTDSERCCNGYPYYDPNDSDY